MKRFIEAMKEDDTKFRRGFDTLGFKTSAGTMVACIGDYIAKDTKGAIYPIGKKFFEANYEEIKEEQDEAM